MISSHSVVLNPQFFSIMIVPGLASRIQVPALQWPPFFCLIYQTTFFMLNKERKEFVDQKISLKRNRGGEREGKQSGREIDQKQ